MPEKVKEDYEVIIRELQKSNEVKDIEFSLNTSQSGKVSYITENINGELEAILISSDTPIQIRITLDGTDIVLFDMTDFSGEKYLPLAIGVLSNTGENFRDGYEKWILNNRLKFEISGGFNSNVKCVVRWK